MLESLPIEENANCRQLGYDFAAIGGDRSANNDLQIRIVKISLLFCGKKKFPSVGSGKT